MLGSVMIRGIGLDIVEIARIERIWNRFGRRFAARILHPNELEMLPDLPIAFLAGRFAVKEAAAKALGTGFDRGIGPLEIETARAASGRPVLCLHGNAAARLKELCAAHCHVSITHGRDTAAAVVVLED
jgi:holo-[acyl-carrier protein] synthase